MFQLKLNEDRSIYLNKTFLSEASCLTDFSKTLLIQLGWIDAGSVIIRSFYNSKLSRWFSIFIQEGKVSVLKNDHTDKGILEEQWSNFVINEWKITQDNSDSSTVEIADMVACGSTLDLQVIQAAVTYVANL